MTFCAHCGQVDGDHAACLRKLEMEPPRFCGECGRRMKVQVIPRGWTAECVEHGQFANAGG